MDRAQVPPAVLTKLRLTCLGLPEVQEEEAWAGTRWCVGKKNFAHVVMIDGGWPPAYAEAAGTHGPACVLTFRLPAPKLASPRFTRPPYFRPKWFPNIAGRVIDEGVDWDEVDTLLTQSYCMLAPKKLVALLDRADL